MDWRANSQLTFPRSVLISPLWLMKRYGWARDQDGKVLVENREWTRPIGALQPLVEQVRVEGPQLGRVEHPLVDHRPAGHRRDVRVRPTRQRAAADGLLDQPPGDVQPAVEGEVAVGTGREVGWAGDERLGHHGLAAPRRGPEAGGIRGHVAPAQEREVLSGQRGLEALDDAVAAGVVARQEDLGDAEAALRAARWPASAATARRKAWGRARRIPAPSPVFASEPDAPRCSRLTRTVSASRTMACEGRPAMSTTKPKPQASCSVDGSYSVRVCGTAMPPAGHPLVGMGRNRTQSTREGQGPWW